MRYLYDASGAIMNEESPEAAAQTYVQFTQLRKAPPETILEAFFPREGNELRAALQVGLHRPIIKMDQGPFGNFAPFTIGANENLRGIIASEQGLAVVETFFQEQLNRLDPSDSARLRIEELIMQFTVQYRQGNHQEASQTLHVLRAQARDAGLTPERRASVGRDMFFCCRPISPESPIVVGEQLAQNVGHVVNTLVNNVTNLAGLAQQFVLDGYDIAHAIKMAEAAHADGEITEVHTDLLYFQPDVLLRRDGTFEIEKINFPDVGLFLTQLDSTDNSAFATVQNIASQLAAEVCSVIADHTDRHLVIMTRDEVLANSEDTLEHKEITALQAGLITKGKEVSVHPLSTIADLPDGTSLVLLNVDPDSSDFAVLLTRFAKGELQCFPNPFIKLFEDKATTLQHIPMTGKVLEKFLSIVAPQAMDKPEGVLRKHQAIQKALAKGGIAQDVDIIYYAIPDVRGTHHIIPAFRYDIRSFVEVAKQVDKLRNEGVPVETIYAIPIPFGPEDAIIQGEDGPRLAGFRFMGVII